MSSIYFTLAKIYYVEEGKLEVDSNLVDSTIKFLFYGQYGLDSITVVNLWNIVYPMQITPFKARHLNVTSDFINCDNRSFDFTTVSEFVKSDPPYPLPKQVPEELSGIKDSIKVHLFPNPTQTELKIQTENFSPGIYLIEIYSLNSDLIMQKKLEFQKVHLTQSINIAPLTNGTYFLVISKDNVISATVKFIKNI